VLVPVPSASDQYLAWTGVGRHWLRFKRSGYHWAVGGYLDLAALLLASGRRLRWQWPSHARVVHTSTRVFATRRRPGATPRLLAARLPI
jgi:hypothetical protein